MRAANGASYMVARNELSLKERRFHLPGRSYYSWRVGVNAVVLRVVEEAARVEAASCPVQEVRDVVHDPL